MSVTRADRAAGGYCSNPSYICATTCSCPTGPAARRDRLPTFPDTPAFTLAPDWICEVISPSTGRIDRSLKMHVYAREGVSHLWLVEPLHETLETYRLDQGRWIVAGTYAADDSVRAAPFDAVELALHRWWMPRDEAPPTR